MSRSVLVVGGVVLLGIGVALYILVGRDSASSGGATTTTTTPGGASGGGVAGDRPRMPDGTPIPRTGEPGGPPPVGGPNAPVITPGDRPRGQGGADGSGAPAGGSSDRYQVGNIEVRDHRGGDQAPIDIPPPVHTPGGPRIESTLTNAIGSKVQAALRECTRTLTLTREGRGAKPRVEGQIVTDVKAGTLTIASAIMQPRDISEADATALKACTEPKLVGVTAAAPGQADLDSYPINLTLTLP